MEFIKTADGAYRRLKNLDVFKLEEHSDGIYSISARYVPTGAQVEVGAGTKNEMERLLATIVGNQATQQHASSIWDGDVEALRAWLDGLGLESVLIWKSADEEMPEDDIVLADPDKLYGTPLILTVGDYVMWNGETLSRTGYSGYDN